MKKVIAFIKSNWKFLLVAIFFIFNAYELIVLNMKLDKLQLSASYVERHVSDIFIIQEKVDSIIKVICPSSRPYSNTIQSKISSIKTDISSIQSDVSSIKSDVNLIKLKNGY